MTALIQERPDATAGAAEPARRSLEAEAASYEAARAEIYEQLPEGWIVASWYVGHFTTLSPPTPDCGPRSSAKVHALGLSNLKSDGFPTASTFALSPAGAVGIGGARRQLGGSICPCNPLASTSPNRPGPDQPQPATRSLR